MCKRVFPVRVECFVLFRGVKPYFGYYLNVGSGLKEGKSDAIDSGRIVCSPVDGRTTPILLYRRKCAVLYLRFLPDSRDWFCFKVVKRNDAR